METIKEKLEHIETNLEPKDTKKKMDRNVEIGINNYQPNIYAPRKVCVKYGSVKCLVVNYKYTNFFMHNNSMFLNLVAQNVHEYYAHMPYVFNIYLAYSNMNIPHVHSYMPFENNVYASSFHNVKNMNTSFRSI